MNSIRKQLLFWQIGALLAVALLVALITYDLAWNGFNRARDFGLAQVAHVIARQSTETTSADGEDVGQYLCQIWHDNGQLAYSSRPAINLPRQGPGFSTLSWQGEEWHVFVLQRGDAHIQVANTAANRALMFSDISRWMLIPLGVLVGVLGALIWMAIGQALRPLELMRGEVEQRGASRLHALDEKKFPDELVPLVDELNQLLQRIDKAIDSQERFIADAAHALRTPLTAIKIQAELLFLSVQDEERIEANDMLRVSVDRAAHLLDQLLKLARFESSVVPRRTQQIVRVDTLVKQVVADFSAMADSREVDLGVGQCDPVEVSADPDALRSVLDNLVDNAIRYGFIGGRIDIEVRAEASDCAIHVIDNGPGIPEKHKAVVFDRFVRLSGPDIPGSGLGLAIVKEVVVSHGGVVSLDACPGGGLDVSITLPSMGFVEG